MSAGNGPQLPVWGEAQVLGRWFWQWSPPWWFSQVWEGPWDEGAAGRGAKTEGGEGMCQSHLQVLPNCCIKFLHKLPWVACCSNLEQLPKLKKKLACQTICGKWLCKENFQGPRKRPHLLLVSTMLPAPASGEQGTSPGWGAACQHQVPVLPGGRPSGLPKSHQAANLSPTWFPRIWRIWRTWRTWRQKYPPGKLNLLSGFVGSKLPPSSDKVRYECRAGAGAVQNRPAWQSRRSADSWVGGSTLSDKWVCFLWQSRHRPTVLKVFLPTHPASPSLQGIAAFLHQVQKSRIQAVRFDFPKPKIRERLPGYPSQTNQRADWTLSNHF